MVKKAFDIQTPRGTMHVMGIHGGGQVIAEMEWNPGFGPKYEKKFGKKQEYIDQECINKMESLTPMRTGVLIKSATLGTVVGSGEIHQIAPYARRQYYEHKSKSYWFERMKNRHKDSILRGAQKIG